LKFKTNIVTNFSSIQTCSLCRKQVSKICSWFCCWRKETNI